MNKELYEIKIGELYINYIDLDNENLDTYGIRSIELHAVYSKKFYSNEVVRVLELLELIGIERDSIIIVKNFKEENHEQ